MNLTPPSPTNSNDPLSLAVSLSLQPTNPQLNLDVPIKHVDYVHGCVTQNPVNDPFKPAPADCADTGSIKPGIVQLANALKVNKYFDQSAIPRELGLRDWHAQH